MLDFKALFDASPNPYVLLDPDLNIVEANEAYLQVTGREREELIGANLFDAFPGNPDDPEDANVHRLRTSFERVLSTGKPDTLALIRYAIPRQTPDGVVFEERYWSSTHTPILDDEGEVAYILQHAVDVTELQKLKEDLKETEKALKEENRGGGIPAEQMEEGVFRRAQTVQEAFWALESERRHLLRLFEQAPGFMVFLRGPEHVFELANEAYYQAVGHRDIIGKPVQEALPEVEGQGYFELLNRVYETGEAFVGREMEVEVQREPGAELDEVFLDFVYQPVTGPDGSVVGIFVQGHDVTEQKRTKDELHRYQEQLEELVRERTRELEESEAALRQAQKMEAIGRLTGGVAHDFNNLLQVIGGNLQLLQRSMNGDEQARRWLQTAVSAVERGGKLASQLLAFARRQPLDPTVISPARLLRDMETLLRRTLGETVEMETIIEDELWNTVVDPHQLENVILNLAINASDAMEGEGRLTIEAGNARLDEDYADAHLEVTPGRYVCLAISDTGRGMSPEEAERAFEPFFTTKSEDRGTGLGLSMAYGFVKQSGGHIKIYSEVGEGTTVRVYLPRTLEEEEEIETEAFDGPVEGGDETILVVEDDDEVRATAVEMLTDLGYQVLEASDGESALAVVHSGVHIDLLFTDVVMPGPVRSTDLAKQAKAHLPDLEVLFTSGYTENAIVHRGQLDPNVSLLSKPYSREDLARKIRHMLRSREQQQGERSAAEAEAAGATEPAPEEDTEPEPQEEAPLRVLLVEDDEDIQLLVSEVVKELGHSVVAVSSAEEAMEAFDGGAFDVLFTDVSMPGMSGVELARELKSQRPDLQVIIATGHGSAVEAEVDEALEEAVFLPKPYDVPGIEEALDQVSNTA